MSDFSERDRELLAMFGMGEDQVRDDVVLNWWFSWRLDWLRRYHSWWQVYLKS